MGISLDVGNRQLRRECLDHILFQDGRHVQRVVREHIAYFNQERPHQGLGQQSLRSARVKANRWTHQNQGDPWRITSQLFLCDLFELTQIVLHQNLTNKGKWYLLTTGKSDQVVFGGL